MKKYVVKVNGKVYEVELESVTETDAKIEVATQAAKPQVSGDGEVVKAPMQGNIIDVKVNVGDKVSSGDVLVVLEAMKLENDIVAPVSGTVKAVNVSKGQTVNNGDKLVVIG